jgi:hypothetical protein
MGIVLTTELGSPVRAALIQWVSWCVYLTDFVRMQPSTPAPGPLKDDIWETEATVRWISGRPNKGGTAANFLTEMRACLVTSDMSHGKNQVS